MVKTDRVKMTQGLFLAHFRSYLSYPFGTLREFFDSVQALFKGEQTKILDWMERETADLSQEEKARFYEWHWEDYEKLEGSFPNVLKNTLFYCYLYRIGGEAQIYLWRSRTRKAVCYPSL